MVSDTVHTGKLRIWLSQISQTKDQQRALISVNFGPVYICMPVCTNTHKGETGAKKATIVFPSFYVFVCFETGFIHYVTQAGLKFLVFLPPAS